MVGDGVDDLAEGAVRTPQAFADQVAAGLQFPQAGAHRVPSVGSGTDESGHGHLPAVPVGADVSEDALRLVGETAVAEQTVRDLRELIAGHRAPADPASGHRTPVSAPSARRPGQHMPLAKARGLVPAVEGTRVRSIQAAHPSTPTRAAATTPDHRSQSRNTSTGQPQSEAWSDPTSRPGVRRPVPGRAALTMAARIQRVRSRAVPRGAMGGGRPLASGR